jgi:phenylacetate-CoA ligase
MDALSQKIYNLFYPSFRNVGATIKGIVIEQERYGEYYSEALKAIIARNKWSRVQLEDYQSFRLHKIIKIAANNFPYYKDLFKNLNISPLDIRTTDDLQKLPILEKNIVRQYPLLFVDDRLNHRNLLHETTNGTTGTPIKVFLSKKTQQIHYAYFEGRCRLIAGMHYGKEPFVTFGSKHVTPIKRDKPPFWCYNHVGKQLYMSVYHLAPQYFRYYLDELNRIPYKAMIGYPSVIAALGQFILNEGIGNIKIPIIITNGETLHTHQREVIKKAFNSKIFNQYGCSELSVFASECSYGKMHVSMDYGIVEIVNERGEKVPPGTTGFLVCTGLVNEEQIFLRYRVGDMATWSEDSCKCGSPLPIIKSIDGRSTNAIILPEGRKVYRMDSVFEDVPFINECQIVQEDIGRFIIKVVASDGFTELHSEKLRRNFASNVGEADISIQLVSDIERKPGGKFEFIVSKVTQ